MRYIKHLALLIVVLYSTLGFANHDQDNTQLIGTYPFGPGHALVYDSTRNVYFVGSGGGVLVMDISQPSNPLVINATITAGDVVRGLAFDAATQRLYVGASDLMIWDVADLQNPTRLAVLPHDGGVATSSSSTSFFANRLSLEGTTLFTVGGTRVHAIDVSDPARPVLEHSLTESPTGIGGVSLSLGDVASKGNRVFVTGTQVDMRIYDYSSTGGFTPLHSTGWNVGTSRNPIVNGNYLFYYSSSFEQGLAVMDISSPDRFSTTSKPLYPQYGEIFAIHGNVGFASNQSAGGRQLELVDISDALSLAPIASLPLPSFVTALAVSSDQIAMITYDADMQFADYSAPAAPALVSSYVLGGASTQVAINASLVLLTQPNSGVQLIDLTEPALPVGKSTIAPVTNTMNAVGQGALAYVLDSRLLRIFDVSDPGAPGLLGQHTITPVQASETLPARSLAVSDAIAMESVNSEVEIIDVSQSASPRLLARYNARSYVWSIRIYGNIAYLSTTDGLQLIDIANPAAPREVGFFSLFVTRDVAVKGGLAFVASADRFVVLDVSKPSAIKQLASRSASGVISALALDGSYIFAANSFNGVQVFNISNPANPVLVGTYADRLVNGLAALSNHFITAGSNFGLKVVENLADGGGRIKRLLPMQVRTKL